ncbi:MAG: cysteine peptidase family C39 domain-containing protein [Dehalobacterium sp.]
MKKILKVPLILQMEAIECGAACLGMILAYYKKYVPLERLRIDCGVSRDGSNGKSLALAAQNYGLRVRAFRVELEELHRIKLPAVIHWNFNHFIVLRGFTKKHVILNDPATGIYQASYEELNRSFTGVVLTFEKTKEFKAGGMRPSGLRFFKKQAAGQKLAFMLLLLLSGATAMISALPSIYAKIFIDNILLKKNEGWLIPLMMAMVITLAVTFTGIILKTYLLTNIKARLGIIANANYIWHVLKLPVDFFSTRFSSDIASRQNDYDAVLTVLCEKLIPVALNFIMLAFYVFFMVKISIFMTAIGIFVIAANLFTIFLVSRKRVHSMRILNREEGSFISATTSTIELIETIKVSGNERNAFQKWAGYYAKKNNAGVTHIKLASKLEQLPKFLGDILYLVILTMGIYSILHGDMTIGTFVAFQGLMALTLNPIAEIADSASKTQEIYGRIERINDVLNYPSDRGYGIEHEQETEEKLHDLAVTDVSFGYNPVAAPVVKNISFKIKRGELVAIVGASGSGKSTIYKLIAGLYQAWSGSISFQGRDISQLSREQLTNSLTVISQSGMMFSGTVFDNITLWDSSIDRGDVLRAAKDAGIHELITKRAGGYDSLVSEGGKNFSGGERQCFEITRALSRNPSILILDEATSALDTISEKKVMDAIKARGITCLVISHRLSAVRDSDLILIIEDGEIVERGTYDELMAAGGKYAKLIHAENGCGDDEG